VAARGRIGGCKRIHQVRQQLQPLSDKLRDLVGLTIGSQIARAEPALEAAQGFIPRTT